jgi:F0F1-type ATP synthase delta subunit
MLEMGIRLDTNTLNGIVRQVGTDLSSSDYYMSEVLGKFGAQSSADETTWRLFAETAGKMKSDYYKSQTLKKVLSKGRLSASTVGTLLRSASGMKSDYYLTELLKEVAGKYALNADTRQYYVEALRGIESDYYRSELLRTLGSDGDWDARTTNLVLESAAAIKSDYYKSESLRALAQAKHVDNWAAFFSAAGTIESDYYKKETLKSALKHSPLTREIVAGVINAASRMKSDSEMAEVLTTVARTYKLDNSLRDAFEKAVDAMDSDYYRGAALSALRRSMAQT